MDKNIDMIINSKFIGSQQTHRKKELHRIDLQEDRGEHLTRLQHIYNFLLFHAIILPILDVYGLYFTLLLLEICLRGNNKLIIIIFPCS